MFKWMKGLLATATLMSLVLSSSFVLGLEDPTRPSAFRSRAVADMDLKLESILISKDRKVAVISGAIVAEGDYVGAVKVISIRKNVVRVLNKGQIQELVLSNVLIRQVK